MPRGAVGPGAPFRLGETRVIKLQHKTRREGGITIRSTWYELDSEGCIEVLEEHAALALQGEMWIEVAPAPVPAPELPKEEFKSQVDDLRGMSKSKLLTLAEGLGLLVDRRTPRLKLASMIKEAQKEK